MKKSFFAFVVLLALGFVSNFASAQVTTATITVVNQTNCNLWAQAYALDLSCNRSCTDQGAVINANSSGTISFICSTIDAMANGYFTIVGVMDLNSGNGIKVGNGCNTNTVGNIVDCQGINRTVTFVAPNTVTIQ